MRDAAVPVPVPSSSTGMPTLTARLPPTPPTPATGADVQRALTTPLADMSLRSPAAHNLPPGSPPQPPQPPLFPPAVLAAAYTPGAPSPPNLLLLDLRPPSAFNAQHLPGALSLPIPSTLLRRPAFPLASVAQMLPPTHRPAFDTWPAAHLILVLEKDRDGLSDGGRGLVAKFDREATDRGLNIRVGGVKGGWEAVRRLMPDVLVAAAPGEGGGGGVGAAASPAQAIAAAAALAHANVSPKRPPLTHAAAGSGSGSGLRDLPMAAFQQSTTSLFSLLTRADVAPPASPAPATPGPLTLPMHNTPPHPKVTTTAASNRHRQGPAQMPMPPSPPLALALSLPALTLSPHSAGPAPSQLPTHPHLSPSTSTSTQPPAPPPSSTTLLATNPFYDNIRQHLELAQGVTGSPFEPLVLPRRVRHWHGWHTGLMPRWLADVVRRSELPPAEEEEEGATPGDLQQAQQPQHSQHAQHSQQPQPQLPQRQGRGSSPPRWPASPPRNGSPRATPPSAGSGAPGTPAAERERERGVDLAPPRSPARLGAAPSSTVPASAASPHPALASRSPSHAKPDGGEALAMQFYKVELGEQRRLMGVMEHHSRETFVVPHQPGAGAAAGVGVGVGGGPATPGPGLGEFGFGVGFANADPNASVQITAPAAVSAQPREYDVDRTPWQDGEAREGQGKDEFPFSITAGIEKGALNRYRNIWPFAHTRVRLPQGTASDGSDYVNASFVHPRGTRRRYVCAQGPLEATRGDFWNLVWDQNITTIIMLTKQTEAGLSKCFPYWTAPMAGPFRLRHISTTGGEDDPSASAGFFDLHGAAAAGHEEPGAIRRVFALSRDGAGERIVTQLQMVSWPDWEVPRSPRCLLDLIRQTNALRAASPRPNAPVLVHCSAGVGRTGSFVLIDAVLDALRSELLATKARIERGERARSPPHDPMHVDTIAGSGTGTTSASPSLSSLSLSLASHYQSSLDSAPTSRSASNSPSPGSHAPLGAKPTLAGRAGSLLPSTEANPQSSQNTFDYKMPRSALARDQPSRTPTPLSELEPDPIQKVLEDMREQRMSLCQSLNQYVFCHRAICEGAIELAEEILGPSDHSASPGMLPGPSTASPSAMDIEPATSGFFPKPTLSIPLHLPHSKRAASKSPEEVERVLSLTPDDLHSRNGSPRPALDGIGHKPSLKRQMTRRGDVQSGSASPSQR